MKLGLNTAALPAMSLEEIARWAAESRFGMLEIACWPVGKKDRRYGGVSHIDVANLDTAKAREFNALLADHGLEISSLAYYPNPLHPDQAHRNEAIGHLKMVIDAAATAGGRNRRHLRRGGPGQGRRAEPGEFARVWPPIVRYARERGIKIAIENCPMLWPRHLARRATTSPTHPRSGGGCSRSSRTTTSGSTTTHRT